MIRRAGILVCAIAALAIGLAFDVRPAAAAGEFSVVPTNLDFGTVPVGTIAKRDITITNVSGATQTPNFSGGAPLDAANFGGSQNCAGKTFAPSDSCSFTYEFEPTTTGSLNTTTTIGIGSDNYPITMKGVGGDPNATTSTAAATTTTAPATPTTAPSGGGGGGGGGSGGGGNTGGGGGLPFVSTTSVAPAPGARATVDEDDVEPGDDQRATVTGFQPGEQLSAVMMPNGQDLGSRVADDQGTARFSWKIDDDTPPGEYEFVATGVASGTVRAVFTVDEDDDDDGLNPWFIVAIVAVIVLIIAVVAYIVARRRRGHPTEPAAATEPTTPPAPPS